MVVLVRKSNIALLVVAFAFSFLTYKMVTDSEITPTSAIPVSSKIVVLDAGHGIPDGGAVGISGVVEQDINLSIAKKVQSLLEKSGAVVIVTRSDENAIAEDLTDKLRQIKRSDLKNRKDIKENSSADIFVSIHLNKFEDSSCKGAQVFYAGGDNGRILGDSLQGELVTMVDPGNKRVAKVADQSIYVLKESTLPSVIVECGFLSNPKEEKLLTTDEYQEKLAWGIYAGIIKYFETVG